MAIKIAVTNKKGGVAKTTTTLALASALMLNGYDVLLVDTDPQCSSTNIYGVETEDNATLYDIIFNNSVASDCIYNTQLGDIIPSDKELRNADREVEISDPFLHHHILQSLENLEDKYDFIIFDTSPSDGILVGNVLMASNYFITPCTCDRLGVQGIIDFYQMANKFMKLNNSLEYLGLLIVKYKRRQNLTHFLEYSRIPEIAKQTNTRVFKTKIRESVKCQEAQTMCKSLFEYAPKSTTAQDYMNLTEEILSLVNKKGL